MRRSAFLRVPLCFFWILLFIIPVVQASPRGEKKFRIEIYGGYSKLNPKDLNLRPEFDHLYEEYNTELRYAFYHAAFGDFVTYSGQADGKFNKIKHALPAGIRMKYELNPGLSVSLGFKYLANRRESQVSYQYDIRIVDPAGLQFHEDFSLFRENSPYSLSVRAYIPMAGIHYMFSTSQSVSLEAYLAAGPMFARCDFMRQRYSSSVNMYEYQVEEISDFEMKGKGTGLALEAGLQASIKMTQGIFFFAEGGYSFQSAGNISGPGSTEFTTRDSNSSGYTESGAWEGTWAVVDSSFNSEWGNNRYSYPTNQYGARGLADFKLDLSGIQFRMGLSFRL